MTAFERENSRERNRPKLNPRLAFLLDQPVDRLRKWARHDHEIQTEWVERVLERSKKRPKAPEPGRPGKEEGKGREGEPGGEGRFQTGDPELEALLERVPRSIVHGLFFPQDPILGKRAPHPMDEPYVSAFLKAQANSVDLGELGVVVRSQVGDFFTAFIPLRLVELLEEMPAVEWIELARPMTIDLNNTLPYAQVSNLQASVPPPGLTGAGVVVGVLDSFLNFYHPDFRNADGAGGDMQGSTRVQFLWDQLLTPQAGEAGPPVGLLAPGTAATYGVEYSQANINADQNAFALPPGAGQPPASPAYTVVRHQSAVASIGASHGTHVAGIAVGNGRAQGGTFVGAAPGAGLIFVRNGTNNFIHGDSTVVADGFAYVFARAGAQPCVVNMSQSDNMGPHDGTTAGAQFIDALLATPGRAVTLAAGNANNRGSHTTGVVPAGGTANAVVNYANDAFGNAPVFNDVLQIWYDGHDRFNVTLTTPGGTVIGPVAPGASSALTALPGGVQVQIVHTLNDARNNDNAITIFITGVGPTQPVPVGNWTIQLAGTTVINGAYEGWIDRNNRGFRAWTAPVENQGTLAVPADALRAIAVGNHDRSGPPPSISATSSAGPSRDGRIKPDISAVGTAVTSTWYQLWNAANPGPSYQAIGGTSMAAPLVAGTIALMFECRGAGLTWSDVKQLLQNAAAAPLGGIPTNAFGWGYLQAANLCAAPAPDVDVWARDHASDTGVEPFVGGVAWLSPDIEVLDMLGNPVANPTYDPASFVNNLIRVTVRNRGTQTARNTEVYLYWGDPATNIPFPAEWRDTGIYTGDPNFVVQGNKIVIPQIAAGGNVQVRYAWAPPAPGSNLRGDDHFCLIARIEQEGDPSNVAAGGWAAIRGSNNIVLRNTHVQEAPPDGGDADTAFYVTGTDDDDRIEIEAENVRGRIEFALPVEALPWRDLGLINEAGERRHAFGTECGIDPVRRITEDLKSDRVTLLTGITGAGGLRVSEGIATIVGDARERITIPDVRVRTGVKMPVRLRVVGAEVAAATGFVHVRQRSAARLTGGVSLELRRELPRPKPVRTFVRDGRLVVED